MIPISDLVSDQQSLALYIPNLVFATDGEDELFDKIHPHICANRSFIEDTVTGHEVPADLAEKVSAIIAMGAFADAAPQLDLVITPNGFGVVSTSDTAPASKDRVERLINQLHDNIDTLIDQVILSLMKSPAWRVSPVGAKFRLSMFHQLKAVRRWRRPGENSLECLQRVSFLALSFESAAAEYLIGESTMQLMRDAFCGISSDEDAEILALAASMFFAKLCAWVSSVADKEIVPDPSEQYLWQSLRLVANTLMRSPSLKELMLSESAAAQRCCQMASARGAIFF